MDLDPGSPPEPASSGSGFDRDRLHFTLLRPLTGAAPPAGSKPAKSRLSRILTWLDARLAPLDRLLGVRPKRPPRRRRRGGDLLRITRVRKLAAPPEEHLQRRADVHRKPHPPAWTPLFPPRNLDVSLTRPMAEALAALRGGVVEMFRRKPKAISQDEWLARAGLTMPVPHLQDPREVYRRMSTRRPLVRRLTSPPRPRPRSVPSSTTSGRKPTPARKTRKPSRRPTRRR